MPQNEKSALHKGHRQRLKQRFLSDGLDQFEPHNLLEILLFFGIPQKDTNPIAHELINTFGSLSAAFDAPFEELLKIKGMTENAAVLMKMVPAIFRRYELDKLDQSAVLKNSRDIGQYIKPFFKGKINEEFYVICLDNTCKVMSCKKLFEGTITSAQISVRKIVETALSCNCANVIVAHNHPQGLAIPSHADICVTNDIYKALKTCEIRLLDHLIVSPSDYVSLMEGGYFSPG